MKQSPKRQHQTLSVSGFVDIGIQVDPVELLTESLRISTGDHDYSCHNCDCSCSKVTCTMCSKKKVVDLEHQLTQMEYERLEVEQILQKAREDITKLEESLLQHKRFSIQHIAHSNELVKMYTGIPTLQVFQWLAYEIRPHAQNLLYFRGNQSMNNDEC